MTIPDSAKPRARAVFRYWGTSEPERQRPFPCDRIVPDNEAACFRGVSVAAEPALVFRWLCQLRVAPYSYDWIDNWGRKSPAVRTPELEDLAVGQDFMGIFDLMDFEAGVHITLRAHSRAGFPTLAVSYLVVPEGAAACRLIVKLAMAIQPGLVGWMVRALGPGLDWIMMRRQLLNLKAHAEGERAHGVGDE